MIGPYLGSDPKTRCLSSGFGEVMVAVKVKKESYHACLTYGALETADGYQQAKWTAVLAVAEANIWVWIEFSEAMDQAFWRTLRQYCQTVW